jgi:nicotinamidase-related amidase
MPTTSDPGTTALLILDCQTGYFESVPGAESLYAPSYEPLLERIELTRRTAKSAGVRIYYVMVEFAEGYPEIGDRAPANFRMVRDEGLLRRGNPETPIHPKIAPEVDDVVVIKHRRGAFIGTDLDRILLGHGIQTIAIAGVRTRGAVLSSVRQAADLDYSLVVLEDLCADSDVEVHRFLVERMFPEFERVTTSDKWIADLDITPA